MPLHQGGFVQGGAARLAQELFLETFDSLLDRVEIDAEGPDDLLKLVV